MRHAFLAAALLFATAASAQDLDASKLYTLSTEGTSKSLKAGEKGTFVLSITTTALAHVSDEAPLSLKLEGKNVTPLKSTLTVVDSVGKPAPGKSFKDPRFEVAITGAAAGEGSISAKVVFFVCTDKLCLRQQKSVSVPVSVRGS